MEVIGIWVTAIALAISFVFVSRATHLPRRWIIGSVIGAVFVGLIFAAGTRAATTLAGRGALGFFACDMILYGAWLMWLRFQENEAALARTLEQHPEFHERMLHHWFFGKWLRHHERRNRKRQE